VKKALVATVVCALSPAALAWGPLGHRVVAETAALLVEDDLPASWGPIIARHRFELGVYAFLPDARFRHVDGASGKIEAPTHYLYLDDASGDPARAGSVDRRIVQFLELARDALEDVRAPKGGYLRGATAEGDARRVYAGLYDLGVMAHYSGDASMPYHATSDTNGYARGEGGIHFYFESDCVNALEPGLAADVLAAARKNRTRWLRAWEADPKRPLPLVKAVLEDSLAAVGKVSELDRRYAVTKLQPAGSRADAQRKPASSGCRKMRPLLVDRLARGAILTAVLWESVLPGEVDFSGASALQFSDMELAADYVPPR
jgi:hypothetical protein